MHFYCVCMYGRFVYTKTICLNRFNASALQFGKKLMWYHRIIVNTVIRWEFFWRCPLIFFIAHCSSVSAVFADVRKYSKSFSIKEKNEKCEFCFVGFFYLPGVLLNFCRVFLFCWFPLVRGTIQNKVYRKLWKRTMICLNLLLFWNQVFSVFLSLQIFFKNKIYKTWQESIIFRFFFFLQKITLRIYLNEIGFYYFRNMP